MKLANVSPKLIAAYRKGKMTLSHIVAFAVTDDHAAQERVWREIAEWQRGNPDAIRALLTKHEITTSDRRVQFVTLKAYEKAVVQLLKLVFAFIAHCFAEKCSIRV
jgi:ParB family chromosome partitioning protein